MIRLRQLDYVNAKLNISARMAILGVSVLVPAVLAVGMLAWTHFREIAATGLERKGVEVSEALWRSGLVAANNNPVSAAAKNAIIAAARPFEAAIGKDDREALINADNSYYLNSVSTVSDKIGDASGLALDGEAASHYLYDALEAQLIKSVAAARGLRDSADLGFTNSVGDVASGNLITGAIAMSAGIAKAYGGADRVPPDLARLTGDYIGAAQALAANANDDTLRRYLGAASALHDFGERDLRRVLDARTDRLVAMMVVELAIVGLALFLSMALALVISQGLKRRLVAFSRSLGSQSADADMFLADDHETGVLARAIGEFRALQAEAAQLRDAQERDRTDVASRRQADMARVAAEFEAQVMNIVEALQQTSALLDVSTDDVARNTERTHALTMAASRELAAAETQVVAAAGNVSQMAGSARAIAGQADQARVATESAAAAAQEAVHIVQQMGEAAQRIGSTVDLIAQIASQTNLLALNATIEAARAGEAGKGFSVVASEVKALTQQTARATHDIQNHIGAVQQASDRASQAITAITGQVIGLSDMSRAIAQSVDQQSNAVTDVSRILADLSRTAASVVRSMAEVQYTAAETGERAEAGKQAANTASAQEKNLRDAAEGFLMRLRRGD